MLKKKMQTAEQPPSLSVEPQTPWPTTTEPERGLMTRCLTAYDTLDASVKYVYDIARMHSLLQSTRSS
jgi:hypothetical protein